MNNNIIDKNSGNISDMDPLWNIWYEVGVLAISMNPSEQKIFLEELGKKENVDILSMIDTNKLRCMKYEMLKKREISPCARNPVAEKLWKEIDKISIHHDSKTGDIICEFPDLNLDKL